jgi:hypothetical protein
MVVHPADAMCDVATVSGFEQNGSACCGNSVRLLRWS